VMQRPQKSLLNSLCGALVGVALAIASCILLFWNEGVAVQTARSLDEGLGKVVTVQNIESSNLFDELPRDKQFDGRFLVHVQGLAEGETLKDEVFGVTTPAKSIRLIRSVEMFQWKEESRQVQQENYDQHTGSRQVAKRTEYFYTKQWAPHPINSESFHRPDEAYPPNPRRFPVESRTVQAEGVKVGKFVLGESLVDQISWSSRLDVNHVSSNVPSLVALPTQSSSSYAVSERKWIAFDGGVQSYKPAQQPQIGDVRVQFKLTKPSSVSMIAEMRKGPSGKYELQAYQTDAGDALAMLSQGSLSAKEMFEHAHQTNNVRTWMLRGVGWLLIFIGFQLLFGPLSAVASVVPLVGDLLGALVSFGTTLIALLLSITLSLLVAGTAWFVYRPLLSVGLFAFAFIPLAYLHQKRKEHRSR